MGKISANEFVKKVAEDAAFRKELGITEEMGLSDFRVRAAAAGYDYSETDLVAATKQLSDEDLDAAAGGAGHVVRSRGIKT